MKAEEIYKKETGKEAYHNGMGPSSSPTYEYLMWLESTLEKRYEPTILRWIKTMFDHAEKKQWFETYWALDVHGTISIPDYRKGEKRSADDKPKVTYYPYARETLQMMSERKDIIMILDTSSYPDESEIYLEQFSKDGIDFKFIGENPDVSSSKGSFGFYEKKFYFNVLFEDKAGFRPKRDWKFLYDYFKETKYQPDPTWSMKYDEDYHKK